MPLDHQAASQFGEDIKSLSEEVVSQDIDHNKEKKKKRRRRRKQKKVVEEDDDPVEGYDESKEPPYDIKE